MSAPRQTATAAYRALLRAQRDLFVGDPPARAKALDETRRAFLANAAAQADDVPALLADAHETALFIRQNVAQTKLNERGNYELTPKPEHMHPDTGVPPPLPCKEDFNR